MHDQIQSQAQLFKQQTHLPHFPLEAGEPGFCRLHQLREHGAAPEEVRVNMWSGNIKKQKIRTTEFRVLAVSLNSLCVVF